MSGPRKPRARRGHDATAAPIAPADATPIEGAFATPQPLFTIAIAVRWRDLDAFNHVNNSAFLTYLEEVRLQWLATVPGPWFDERAMPVLAASTLNYRAPISWPGTLRVELYRVRLGSSSLTIAHRVVDAVEPARLYCDGEVVMVWMDPATGRSVPLPQAIRDACA
ncbi:MAG TPA: thioesterase family protein [Rhodanobacteraceae bacterium]|nr:thioesterase family protein [Rhodanobacteraceae bacterium]